MKLQISSIGRWSNGPEKGVYDHYAARIDKTGRSIGIGPLTLKEITFKKPADRTIEADALLDSLSPDAFVLALDEKGKSASSDVIANLIGEQRDLGRSNFAVLIGGADGHGPAIKQKSDRLLSLGAMTWPHLLVRGLMAEQFYRAITILSGHPYHRE